MLRRKFSLRFAIALFIICLGSMSFALPVRADSIDLYLRRYLNKNERRIPPPRQQVGVKERQ